jgi:hypothetical protein
MILLAGALPWALMAWLEDRVPTSLAASLTLGLTLAYPFLFAASQIYPDLPAGVIVTVLAVWLIMQIDRREGGLRWAGFWLIVGALPMAPRPGHVCAATTLAGGRRGAGGLRADAATALTLLAGVVRLGHRAELDAARALWGGGAVGRFGWTAAWLWSIPLGVAIAPYWRTLARYLHPAIVASLAYEAALAIRWLPAPRLLFPRLNDLRDSLFPDTLRPWLPSFYFWDFSSYWWFPPNVVAMAVVALVVVAGALAIPPATSAADPPGNS